MWSYIFSLTQVDRQIFFSKDIFPHCCLLVLLPEKWRKWVKHIQLWGCCETFLKMYCWNLEWQLLSYMMPNTSKEFCALHKCQSVLWNCWMKREKCKFFRSLMSLYIIGNEKNRRFFFHIRENCFQERTLLTRVGITALSEARAVIETQGSKIPPEDTLLSEMEQNSRGLFFISDVGWDFLLFYT